MATIIRLNCEISL